MLGREPQKNINMTREEAVKNITVELSVLNSNKEITGWILKLLEFSHNLGSKDISKAVETLLKSQESVLDSIQYIYEKCVLDDRKKIMFREAIKDLLQSENTPELVFEDLSYIITNIKAFELLEPLAQRVGNGSLGQTAPHLIYDTLAALKSSPSSNEVYQATLTLINSKNFNDSFLFDAINILLKCEPSRKEEILKTFELRIANFRQLAEKLGKIAEFNISMQRYPWYRK